MKFFVRKTRTVTALVAVEAKTEAEALLEAAKEPLSGSATTETSQVEAIEGPLALNWSMVGPSLVLVARPPLGHQFSHQGHELLWGALSSQFPLVHHQLTPARCEFRFGEELSHTQMESVESAVRGVGLSSTALRC